MKERKTISVKNRLFNKINIKGENDCWPWSGYVKKQDGKGYININKNPVGVQKVVYELEKGIVDKNFPIITSCGNKLCCNAKHLLHDIVSVFWNKVNIKEEDDCWPWKEGASPKGYGQFYDRKNVWRAHRYAYKIVQGDIPDKLFVCHTCDNPPCCNPKHLFLGDNQSNVDDMMNKKRKRVGSDCRNAKLNESQVIKIRKMYKTGNYTLVSLGELFKVDCSTIGNLITKKTWKHI